MSYEVYAVRYAHRESSMKHEHFFGLDPCHDTPYPIDYFVWFIIGSDRVVMLDCGYTPEVALERGSRQHIGSPFEVLEQLGRSTSDISDIVISHLHYDHTGYAHSLPKAHVWLQREELEFWTSELINRGNYQHLFENSDVAYLQGLSSTGLTLLDGDKEIYPGIKLHKVGGHTAGMQFVSVDTGGKTIVLASDASHFYENIQTDRPYALIDHLPSMYLAFDKAKQLASDESLIIPGHDPLVLERFPAARPGLEGRAVLLS